MSKKKDPGRLSLLLGDIDPALLEEAYMTDSPEKLAKLRMQTHPRRVITMPRLAVAMISFILALSMMLSVFILLRPETPGVEPPTGTPGDVTDTPDQPYVDPATIDAPWKTGKLTLTSLTYKPAADSLSTGRLSFDKLTDVETDAATDAVTDAITDAVTDAVTDAEIQTPDAPVFGQGENVQVSIMDNTKISDYMGPDLIKTRPAEGEHMGCADVYYNIHTDEIVCMSCRVLALVQGTELYTYAAIDAFMEEILLDEVNLWASGEVNGWRETYSRILYSDKARELFSQLKKPTLSKLGIDDFAFDSHEVYVKEHIGDYKYPVVDIVEYGADPDKCLFSLVSPLTGIAYGSYVMDLTTNTAVRVDQTLANAMGDYVRCPELSLAESITVLDHYSKIVVTLPYQVQYYHLRNGHRIPVYAMNAVLLFDVDTGVYRQISYHDGELYSPAAPATVYNNVICYPSGSLWCFYLISTDTLYTVEGDFARVITSGQGISYAVMKQTDGYHFFELTGKNGAFAPAEVEGEDFDLANRFVMEGNLRVDVLTGETVSLWDGTPTATAVSKDGRFMYLYFEGADHILCIDVCKAERGAISLSEGFVTQAAEAAASGTVTYGLFLNAAEDALLMTYCKEGMVVFDSVGYSDHNHMHDPLGDILNFYTVNGQKLHFVNKENALHLLKLFFTLKELDVYTEEISTGINLPHSPLYLESAEELIPYLDVWGNNAELPAKILYAMIGDMTLGELTDMTYTNDIREMLTYYYKESRINTNYGYERTRALDYMARDVAKAMAEFFCVELTDEQMTAIKALLLPRLDAIVDENFQSSTAELDATFKDAFDEACPILTGMTYDAFIKTAGFLAWEDRYIDVESDGYVHDFSRYCAKTDVVGDVRLSLQKKLGNAYLTEFLSGLTFEAGEKTVTPITSLFRSYSDVGGLPYAGLSSFLHVGYDEAGNAFVVVDGYYAPITVDEAETFKRTHVQKNQQYICRDWYWY